MAAHSPRFPILTQVKSCPTAKGINRAADLDGARNGSDAADEIVRHAVLFATRKDEWPIGLACASVPAMSLRSSALALLLLAGAAEAEPLTIRGGESWVFAIERGQPVRAKRVAPSTAPRRGQVKVSLVSARGSTMSVTNNSPVSYTYRAELVGAPASYAAKSRTCTLPANGVPTLEYWPVPVKAVRIGNFAPATAAGNCP